MTDPNCEKDKQLVFTDGTKTTLELTGYDIPSYASYRRCFDDIAEGNRDTAQVSAEEAQRFKDMKKDQSLQAGIGFIT